MSDITIELPEGVIIQRRKLSMTKPAAMSIRGKINVAIRGEKLRPCKWRDYGCTEQLGALKMRKHEPRCPCKPA